MVKFIFGPHGSGKTDFLIKNVLADAASAMLIVPRQITFLTDERLLDTLGPEKASEIEVLSIKRLCDNVMKTVSGISKKPLRDGVNAIIMLRVLEELKDNLKVYGGTPSLTLVQRLLGEIRRFKTSGANVETVLSARIPGADELNQKLEDLALIYQRYNDILAGDYYDENDLLDEICRFIASGGFFEGKTVAFDGFSSFTAQQMKLIALAAKQADDVYIAFSSDDFGSKKTLSSPFSYVNSTVKRLKRLLKDETGESETETLVSSQINPGFSPYRSADIKVLAENIFRKDAEIPAAGDGVKLFCGAGIDNECDYVAGEIKKLLRSGEYRCRDIAVAFRSFDTYPTRLANSFRKFGVPYFEDRRQPVANSPLIILVCALLELSVPGRFTDDAVFKYLKSGLTGIDRDDISALENYAFMWDLPGGEFRRPFSKNPFGFSKEFDEKASAELRKLNAVRESFIPSLESFIAKVSDSTGRDICAAVYAFLSENKIDAALKSYAISLQAAGDTALAAEQGEVWDALMELLDDIAVTVGDTFIDTKTFFELFTLSVESKTIGRLPSRFDEVTLCSFDRLANYLPKVLFSVGCNDGVFPLYAPPVSVFTENERHALIENGKDAGIVDDDIDNVTYEHFLIYLALSSASDKLFVTCSDMDTRGKKLQPSDIFSMIRRCLTGLDFEKEDTSLENMVQSETGAFEYYLRHCSENSVETKSLESYFASRGDWFGRMEQMKRIRQNEPFAIKNTDNAKALFGEKMKISASRIESYESCPFGFFCRYGIGANEREKAKFDARNIGNTAHEILEKLFKAHKKADFTAENEKYLNEEIEALLKDYLDQKMGGEEDKTKRFLYLYFRVKKILAVTIKRMIKQLSLSPFEPVAFETKIGDGRSIPSLKIPFENGSIEIIGTIDRIDEARLDGEVFVNVIDYKTNKNKEFKLSDVLEGINLQMVIYLIALAEGGMNGEKPIPSGVLYSIINGEPLKSGDKKEAFFEKMLNGMLLEDLRINYTSDANGIFPIDNRYTAEDFELISKRVKGMIADMGESLLEGKIPASPYLKGKSGGEHEDTPCRWCAYKSVCARSELDESRIRRLKRSGSGKNEFATALKKLREEAENNA